MRDPFDRSTHAPLDRNQFPLTLATGFAAFADFAAEPIPEKLATLLSRLEANGVSRIESDADRGQLRPAQAVRSFESIYRKGEKVRGTRKQRPRRTTQKRVD